MIIITAIGISRNRLIKAQQEKLSIVEASEKKYRNLVESINDAVFIINDQGVLLFANTELVKLLGIPLDEIIDQPLPVNFQVKDFLSSIEKTLKTGKVVKVEYDVIIGRQLLWFETILIPQYEAETSSHNVLEYHVI